MNNIRTEITKTVDQLRVLLGMFEGFNLQEESQEQTRAQEQAQAQEPAQEEIVNIFESAPAPCPAPARLQVNFQSSYLRNKATPTIKNYINMIIDRGFNEEICDNLINLYATSVWKFCTTLHNYGIAANNIQRLQINHLQDWTTLCTVFDQDRIFLTPQISRQDFLRYVQVIFPIPNKAMLADFNALMTKVTRRSSVDAHIVYMFIVCNLVNNNSLEEATRFQTLLENRFLSLIAFVPKIGKDHKWVVRKVNNSVQGKLHFVPHR